MPTKDAGDRDDAISGYEAALWRMADTLRGSMDAAEYKHVVLGLIFLKYISDAFEEHHASLQQIEGADTEDPDEYRGDNIFWVPPEGRWSNIRNMARQPTIGQIIDGAMDAVERENPALRDVLPKDYARPALDARRLGQLIDMISNIRVGDAEARSRDVLGGIYEYFLAQFAGKEGKKGGEFYTPRSIVRLLVEMLQPYRGRVYDPCCGSAGMFVQSGEFIAAHASGNGNGGRARGDISIYGQESNHTTWRLAKMNLAIRGIDGQIAHGDSFHNDRHPDLRADYILANPPFNVSDWGGERLREDLRWKYGVPPRGNANFAWVQHILHHLAPRGVAGFVLANGSMSSGQREESAIRRHLVEAGLVDCMVALPGQLFYSTQIPACLWFLARGRRRRGELLFIDARQMGRMVEGSRTQRELSDGDIARIADTYHAWRDEAAEYADEPGFCKSASLEEVAKHDHVLTPGRYVGMAPQEEDDEPFAEKVARLLAELQEQRSTGLSNFQFNHFLDEEILPIPPLAKQHAIAQILGTLDDKIKLNRRMNETLEAMARALFKSWFVDFDPVRAKMAGRDTGLLPHVADLFPDRLVPSELGQIPAGWEVKPISSFATIKGGRQLKREQYVESGPVPVFGGAGVMGHTDIYNADGFVVSFGRVGAYCGQFSSYRGKAWINNNASRVSNYKGVPGEWLLLALRNLDINLIKKGAAQPFISNSDLGAMKIVSPLPHILKEFTRLSRPMFVHSEQNERESQTLVSLRDTLLPRLMSGELRVKDAEALLKRQMR